MNSRAPPWRGHHFRKRPHVPVPHLDESLDGARRRRPRHPVDVSNLSLGRREALHPRDRDAGGPGVDVAHVQLATDRQPETMALAHGEAMDAGMPTQHAASLVDDLAAALARLGTDLLDDVHVASLRHEADLLTLGLVGGSQAEGAGTGAHLAFRQLAQRKPGGLELALVELEEEVALVLVAVARA